MPAAPTLSARSADMLALAASPAGPTADHAARLLYARDRHELLEAELPGVGDARRQRDAAEACAHAARLALALAWAETTAAPPVALEAARLALGGAVGRSDGLREIAEAHYRRRVVAGLLPDVPDLLPLRDAVDDRAHAVALRVVAARDRLGDAERVEVGDAAAAVGRATSRVYVPNGAPRVPETAAQYLRAAELAADHAEAVADRVGV